LTTKESIVSSSIFSGPRCIYKFQFLVGDLEIRQLDKF